MELGIKFLEVKQPGKDLQTFLGCLKLYLDAEQGIGKQLRRLTGKEDL